MAAIELVPMKMSRDTIACLEQLLQGAKDGQITGIAFAATLKGGLKYITDASGECYRRPTFARGAIATLSDELGDLIHQRDPEATR